MIRSRGYSVATYATLQSAYHNKPTPLQEASYGLYLTGLVKSGDADGLRLALDAGLSTHPSNSHGESLLHMICRRGDSTLLSVMLEAGCDVQVSDDYGRTPLHDACWAANKPAFDVVEKLIERVDVSLFYMTDCHGAAPLSYVREEHWAQWLQFLESKKDVYWPHRSGEQPPPVLTLQKPNSRPYSQPEKPLTVELARMVANGRMKPSEAKFLQYGDPTNIYMEDSEFNDEDTNFCGDLSVGDISWDERDMRDILESILEHRPLAWSK
jgi:Ankyrin repeats (3 copies)